MNIFKKPTPAEIKEFSAELHAFLRDEMKLSEAKTTASKRSASSTTRRDIRKTLPRLRGGTTTGTNAYSY